MKRLKILLSAYACEPHKGSEPAVGWNWVKQISKHHDVWVITRANNREVIEEIVAKKTISNTTFIYVDLPNYLTFWKKGRQGIHLYYYLWQIAIYFTAKKLHNKIRFDIVHHVTFVNYWLPSFLALLPPPFIWGPVGGGDFTPFPFLRNMGVRGKIVESIRYIVCHLFEYDPFLIMTARKARVAIAVTPKTGIRLTKLGVKKIEYLSQVGLSKDDFTTINDQLSVTTNGQFRMISVGSLIPLKGFDMGLSAFQKLIKEFPDSEYWIIGDGSERQNLINLAQRLGIHSQVRMIKNISRDEVFQKISECHVLVHPSLHDSGGMVCAEAMALGKPVICLDLGGPALQVTDKTGVLIKANSPSQVINEIYKALKFFIENEEHLKSKGIAAKKRVLENFSWESKGEEINKVYHKVIGESSTNT